MTSVYGPAADAAEELRDALDAAFLVAESNGGPTAPDPVFVNEGTPAAPPPGGCQEQVVVYLEGLGVSLADGSGGGVLNKATVAEVRIDLAAQAFRCAATMDNQGNVKVADAEAVARTVNSDAYVMLLAVLEGVANKTLFAECSRVAVREVVGVEALGGIVGSVIRLSVTL